MHERLQRPRPRPCGAFKEQRALRNVTFECRFIEDLERYSIKTSLEMVRTGNVLDLVTLTP